MGISMVQPTGIVQLVLSPDIFLLFAGADHGVRVERVIRDDVVFHQRTQVLVSALRKQECVDLEAQLLPVAVRGCKDRQALAAELGEFLKEAGTVKSGFCGRKLGGEDLDEVENIGRRKEKCINSVHDAVLSVLGPC